MKSLIDSDINLAGSLDEKVYISGNNAYRPLFIKSGNVNINNLSFRHGKAKGGSSRRKSGWRGSSPGDGLGGAGAGAGLGGALFVYSGIVTIENVVFSDNNATGGSSVNTISNDYLEGGGGGMASGYPGYGGGGFFSPLEDTAVFRYDGGYGGNGNYGGFGGDGETDGGNGWGGGDGGFGGGGGFGFLNNGGNGGFGGGGGYAYRTYAGHGGFGGGGGAGFFYYASRSIFGYKGGNGG
ncbi:MAG: hypothetical protein GY942_26790, partial [Aestuariibacter sp.]|nr:hypothetical protein [Aestuariibacter sp.]